MGCCICGTTQRGATNAAAHFAEFKTHFLTKSWRFGERIAELSNALLGLEDQPLCGNPERNTSINSRAAETFLFRYNGTLVEKAIELHAQTRAFSIAGGKQRLLTIIDDLIRFQSGERPLNPQMFGFESWQEFVEHHLQQERSEFRTFIKLLQQHGSDKVYRSLHSASDQAEPNSIVLTTGHQAKGREWSSVEISDDFLVPLPEPAEDRLLYVALTRSIDNLNLSDDLFERVIRGLHNAKKEVVPVEPESAPVQQIITTPSTTSAVSKYEVPAATVPSDRVIAPSKPPPAFGGQQGRNIVIWMVSLLAVLVVLMYLAK